MEKIKFDTQHLINCVEVVARQRFDGHYSIFKFTSDYKGAFGTPLSEGSKYEDGLTCILDKLPSHKSLDELLMNMLFSEYTFDPKGI